ncbi:hypothetical protein GCWU000324_02836 [Kingella oralis ATCC 51147]|uniref:Uncharacterized protein n=1 Tax=Kingella oralis ATCC 51147 TaxID=629741 RepID=C4GMA3_9NEIS|nr:hypothetical protein GCWU000324_02836 [Kingella oralis ATCC 51147]
MLVLASLKPAAFRLPEIINDLPCRIRLSLRRIIQYTTQPISPQRATLFSSCPVWLNLCKGHPIGRHFRLTAPLKRLKP